MKQIQVSDHALIRFLERVHGLDVEATRKELAKQLSPLWAGVPNQSITHGGMRYVIREGYLVTVMVNDSPWMKADGERRKGRT